MRSTKASGSVPSITRGSARSTIAASSPRAGGRDDTGWGVAPIFRVATTATNQSMELGRAIVTISPSSPRRRAVVGREHRRLLRLRARVTLCSPHVMAAREGSATARSARRRENETDGGRSKPPIAERVTDLKGRCLAPDDKAGRSWSRSSRIVGVAEAELPNDLVASISRDVRPRKRLSSSPRCPPGQV